MAEITPETQVADEVTFGTEKGVVTRIIDIGLTRVAEVEIPVTSIKTVYVEIPKAPPVEEPLAEAAPVEN